MTVKIATNKTMATAIALFLVLTIAVTLIALPVASGKISVVVYVAVYPKISGLGQPIDVTVFFTPMPAVLQTFKDVYIVFTRPDGTTATIGPFETYHEGTLFTAYTPDKLGNWSVKVTWAGDATYEGTVSESFKFTVQQEPLPSYPPSQLPSEYWERPINAENREWWTISGEWYNAQRGGSYNASRGCFNPYSKAPETSHILWKNKQLIGGLVGGEVGPYYSQAQYAESPFAVIMGGRVYYTTNNGINCLDERTGKLLWVVADTGTLYGVRGPVQYAGTPMGTRNPQPMFHTYLWTASSASMKQYDASTGALLMTVAAPTNRTFGTTWLDVMEQTGYTYTTTTRPNGTRTYEIVKWDLLNWSSNFNDRIIWEAWAPATANNPLIPSTSVNFYLWGNYIFMGCNGGYLTIGWNAKTGQLLFNTTRSNFLICIGTSGYGKCFYPSSTDRRLYAYDLATGNEAWKSDPADYPWGSFWAYSMGCAYDKVYANCYDGHLYAYDAATGKTVWKFYSGDTVESSYNARPFWGPPAIADGKVYSGTSEHTPTQPMTRGNRLYCLNASTGDEIWSIAFGAGGGKSIADGELIACNDYDQVMYCFDKGQTATTVEAPMTAVTAGDSVVIQGKVTDQSPAQTGTAAIADEYMSLWMEYLHMQKPRPTNATGVEVTIDAVDPNNNFIHIGTATSDTSSLYSYAWKTPNVPGKYTIIATFAGSKSYYSSYEETAMVVTEAPAATPTPTPLALPPTETYFAVSTIAIIIAIAVAVLLLRKK